MVTNFAQTNLIFRGPIQLFIRYRATWASSHLTITIDRARLLCCVEKRRVKNKQSRTSISTYLRPRGWEVRRNCRTTSLRARVLWWTDPPLYFSLDLWWQFLHHCWINVLNAEHPCVTARGFSTTVGVVPILSLRRHVVFFSFVCFRRTPWTKCHHEYSQMKKCQMWQWLNQYLHHCILQSTKPWWVQISPSDFLFSWKVDWPRERNFNIDEDPYRHEASLMTWKLKNSL